jgi:hypothetical protein
MNSILKRREMEIARTCHENEIPAKTERVLFTSLKEWEKTAPD